MKMTASINNSLYWIVATSFLQFDAKPPISKGVTVFSVISPEYMNEISPSFGNDVFITTTNLSFHVGFCSKTKRS
jgi:hypothetical protein